MGEACEAASSRFSVIRDGVADLWTRRLRTPAFGLLVAIVIVPLVSCDAGPGWFRKRVAACPRPQIATASSPEFNQQQQEIRALRQQGFRGDFFAQLELAKRYEGERPADKNLDDPVESAVWYAMALANDGGYAPIAGAARRRQREDQALRYDDCRAFERKSAYVALNRDLTNMSTDEREKVRNRVIYILSSQGPEGFRTLARISDATFAPFGEPSDNMQALQAQGPKWQTAAPAAVSLFPRNDVDAYMYNYLAVQTGDVSAYVMLKDFERSSAQRAAYGTLVEGKARRWTPPYEFYPPDAPQSGVPHSDESDPRGDVNETALSRIYELPFVHVGEALAYLRVAPHPVKDERELQTVEVQAFQQMLGRPATGRLSPTERVRAIQYAAVNGSSKAQLVLAVMYSEGVGVPRDYARAFHWYEEADRQGSAEAKYAISTFFSLGIAGVADQDKAQAVVYQIDGALSGFKPSVGRLQQVLAQVSRGERAGGRADDGPPAGGPSGERDYR
jgi:uncharacterized protein